jgi:hypothetical protein
MLIDMDARKVWFTRNGKNMGLAFNGIPGAICPQFGMKESGDRLRLLRASLSVPGTPAAARLSSLRNVYTLTRAVEQQGALPEHLLQAVYTAYTTWRTGQFVRFRSKSGILVTFDTIHGLEGFTAGQEIAHQGLRYLCIGSYGGHVWFKLLDQTEDHGWKINEIWYFGANGPVAAGRSAAPAPATSTPASVPAPSSSLFSAAYGVNPAHIDVVDHPSSPPASSASSPSFLPNSPATMFASSESSSPASATGAAAEPATDQKPVVHAAVLPYKEYVSLLTAHLQQWSSILPIIQQFGIDDIPTNVRVARVHRLAAEAGMTNLPLLEVFYGLALFLNAEAEKCLPLIDFASYATFTATELEFLRKSLFFFTKV